MAGEEPVEVASMGSMTGLLAAAAVTPPGPEYLALTEDVQITQAIQDLAAELNHHPVEIYNWVRNNVVFVPTYGSVQGSEQCLLTRECNSFDTTSLLIALFRASGIPARYVVGTVQMPIDRFMTAIGGFENADAATNFAASSDLPIVNLISGGRIASVRFEHVWAEAWVDYKPSRGARNIAGDTWVPIEGSLKELTFTAGLDVEAVVSDVPREAFQQALASAEEGPDGDWVTAVDPQRLRNGLDLAMDEVDEHLESELSEAPLRRIVGALEVVPQSSPILPATLPGRVVARSPGYAALPSSLRRVVTLRIGDLERSWSSPELAGRRITLGYIPASEADSETIESHGGLYNAPPYLVSLRPVVRLDGNLIASGSAVQMGSSQRVEVAAQDPTADDWIVSHDLVVGSFNTVGLDTQRTSVEAVEQRIARMQATLDSLGEEDVTWDELVGELLYLHALTYLLEADVSLRSLANPARIAYAKKGAELLVGYEPVIEYRFGVPHDVADTGMRMDVQRYEIARESRDGVPDAPTNFTKLVGAVLSGHEHGVFEELQQIAAVSTTSQLAEANNRSIPIYHVTAGNLERVLGQLELAPEVIADIRSATGAGLEVFVPKQNVPVGSWDGVGYAIIDPISGSGAYLISGGLNGSDTAETSDILNDLGDLLGVLEFATDTASYLAKAGAAASSYSTAIKDFSDVLTGLSLLLTGATMYYKTGDPLSAAGAVAIEYLLIQLAGVLASFFFKALIAAKVAPLLAGVFVALAFASLLTLIKEWIFAQVFSAMLLDRKTRVV